MEKYGKIVKGKKLPLEKQYEQVLKQFPYLIDPKFTSGSVSNQYTITLKNGATRYIDIISISSEEINIAELKKDKIQPVNITQLTEYVDHMKIQHPDKQINGFLVGDSISEQDRELLRQKGFEYRQYNRDIPLNLKICMQCRKAVREDVEECPSCKKKFFLPY